MRQRLRRRFESVGEESVGEVRRVHAFDHFGVEQREDVGMQGVGRGRSSVRICSSNAERSATLAPRMVPKAV